MMRRIAVLDAPSNLGLRPPTATSVPGCAKAPGALRDQDLIARLGARDAGCLTPSRYDPGDWRPGDGVAHAGAIAAYSRALAERIGAIIDRGEFPVVLGGDCSIVLGSALAMHRLGEAVGGRIGLVYVDGHSDFRHPGNASYVGAAAGEGLALVTGRGQPDLASIEGRRPYFRDVDVVVLGVRAQDEYRLDLQAAGIVTRPVPMLRAEGAARTAQWAHDQLADCAGYWVHVDVDVLDPAVMPAVDAPDPGGIAFPELELLLAGLVDTPHCLGVEITVFDPDYDPEGTYAAEIVGTLAAGLAPVTTPETPPARLLPTQPSATGRGLRSVREPAAVPASATSAPAGTSTRPGATSAFGPVSAFGAEVANVGADRASARAGKASNAPRRGLSSVAGMGVEAIPVEPVPAPVPVPTPAPVSGPTEFGPAPGDEDLPTTEAAASPPAPGREPEDPAEGRGATASAPLPRTPEPVGPPPSAGPGRLRRTPAVEPAAGTAATEVDAPGTAAEPA
ncbi:arginase [Micromonospora pisi]|uniref:Arginase n=1 Tax=Micromonospora pisi TaxID=589240 RepID=A0A495JG95_9ACTN|nr:arginase [Micromonospora pisi]